MASRRKHCMLVAGASGVVGHAAVEHFATRPDWEVIALSRRPVALPDGVRHVAVDLMDPAACARAARELSGVTHVLYAALFELPELVAGWRDPRQMATNEAMLRQPGEAFDARWVEGIASHAPAFGPACPWRATTGETRSRDAPPVPVVRPPGGPTPGSRTRGEQRSRALAIFRATPRIPGPWDLVVASCSVGKPAWIASVEVATREPQRKPPR